MLFSHKIIIIMIACFIIAFDFSMIYFVNKSEDLLYNTEYKTAKNEQAFIVKNIKDIISNIEERFDYIDEKVCNNVVSGYKTFYKLYDTEIELVKDENLPQKLINNKKIVIIEKIFLSDGSINIVYEKNIDDLRNIKYQWEKMFILLNITFILFIALFIKIILKKITQPLYDIINGIKILEKGDYNNKINVKTNDEFAQIANEFNKMSDTIKNNVEKLKTAVNENQTLAENMAHELKNPLTSIKGFSEYLLKGNIDEANKFIALEYILNETNRLQDLCSKILNISLLKHGELKTEIIDITEIIDNVKKIEYKKITENNISLNIDKNINYIAADKTLIVSLIANLIDNAINASTNGSSVYLSLKESNNKIYIIVEDNGKGIDEENIHKIFNSFYRVDKARSRENGGSGLGLALCRSIVELHKGSIKVFSQINKGTKIEIILPNLNI